MPTMDETYWKCEYENLRRKKNKQVSSMNTQMCRFMDITYELLRDLGLKDEDILSYYYLKQKGKI